MGLYILLLGVQGAGKGVQAKYIQETFSIPHISTGDLFRAMKTREDELAQQVQKIMAEGRLVDDETTCAIVADRLAQPDAANGVIFDGFPRNIVQADWLTEHLAGKGEKLSVVLLLQLDLYTAFKRAFGRVLAADGSSHNIYFNDGEIGDWRFEDHPEQAYPPRLVAASPSGEPLQRRPDDANAHAILKRIDTYLQTTQPLIDYYGEKGVLKSVNADQTIEAVGESVKVAIKQVK